MKILLTFLSVLLLNAIVCLADVFPFLPSTPILIAGPQGRPIPNAVVSIVDPITGLPPPQVWMDKDGTMPFNQQVPPDQILQFYTNAGIYLVNVSGSGITKIFYVVVGEGIGQSIRTISIDRTADVMLNTATDAPALFCPTNGAPCFLPMTKEPLSGPITFDFVMPTFPLAFKSLTGEWFADVTTGGVALYVDWCTYAVDTVACVPTGVNRFLVKTTVSTTLEGATYFTVLPTQWAVSWLPNQHVVVLLIRQPFDTFDTIEGAANLRNARVEFVRQ